MFEYFSFLFKTWHVLGGLGDWSKAKLDKWLTTGGSTVAQHALQHLEVKGSSLVAVIGAGRVKMVK
jgi:hypothetical protein